jgi:hypothetical protein
VSEPLDLSAGRRLTEEELARVSPILARLVGSDFVDAYDGPGGTFVVYARALSSQYFVSTIHGDGPTMIAVSDLPGWTDTFAIAAAHALAAGAIAASAEERDGCLEISESDSDRAYDAHRAASRASHAITPPTGLLQRRFRSVQWGVTQDGLDFDLLLHGLWNEDKTTLTLLLGRELHPFDRLYHRFEDGKLVTVDVRAIWRGDWRVVEAFEAGMRRHLPDAAVTESDGTPWTAAGSRSRLEGGADVRIALHFDLAGARLLGQVRAFQEDGEQCYHLLIMAKSPNG